MVALQELPERDKDRMLPLFQLRPWVSAARLDSALIRLVEVYGERPCYITLAEPEAIEGRRREVHDELDRLRDPADGFAAWCRFVEERPWIMPALQLTDAGQFPAQAARLHRLDRGLIVHIESAAIPFARQIVTSTAASTENGRDVVFLFDFGKQGHNILLRQAEAVGLARLVNELAPEGRTAFSASTFPDGFTTISDQAIFERQLFDAVARHHGPERLIYSDRGSARAERQTGGGGAPAPRIDYARSVHWNFFRSDDATDRQSAYRREAARLIAREDIWDPDLRLWGTQMIERTSLGDATAITSPARATAVRINIHLHRQLFYGDEGGLYETDEDWTD